MKIDVVMCTWNSNKSWFSRCLRSIRREIPIHHLIVIDRFSDDNTVDVIRSFFPESRIIESRANLAKAREQAIREVDTQLFAFIDDDIELCEGWFKTMFSAMTKEVGAIQGLALPVAEWLRKWSLFSPEMARELRREWRPVRGMYLCNTLVRTSLVKDWQPPSILCSGEDMHLSIHIDRKGFRIISLNDLHVKHYAYWHISSSKKASWHGAGWRIIFGNSKFAYYVRKFSTSFPKGLYAALRLREPYIIPYVILTSWYQLKGFLQWNKNLILERTCYF